MKVYQNMHKQVTGFTLVVLLAGLSGCDWFSSSKMAKEDGSGADVHHDKNVLVLMNGKPLITVERLKQEKIDLIEANPQLKGMAAFMDSKQFERNFTDGLTNQAVVDAYIADKKIDQSNEYKLEMERMLRSVKHMLNTKFFSQNLTAEVTDTEVKEFYDKNKECIPNALISQGGVKAVGISFDTQAKAQEFVGKVNEQKGNLQSAAEAANLKAKVQDFNLVNEQSIGLDTQLRDKIIALPKVPTVEVIKVDDKTYWVVKATEKQEAKYQPFEQIKANLSRMLQQEKRNELIEKEITKLRADYKIEIKEDYFAPAADESKEHEESEVMPEHGKKDEVKG